MKSSYRLILSAMVAIAILVVHPALAAADMNPFDTSGTESNPAGSGGTGNSDWYRIPDESQLPALFEYLGIPYSDESRDWVLEIGITRPDGSTWYPYSGYSTPGDTGWSSPLTPIEVPVSPVLTPTPTLTLVIPGEFTIPGMTPGWWSPLTPIGVPVSPVPTPTPSLTPIIPGEFTIPGMTPGWWSPLTPAEPVSPITTLTPLPTETTGGQTGQAQVSITELNLQGKYLKLRNNGVTPVVMTGWKITNGKGRSITFIDWPQGGGSTFTYVLNPLSTVTVHYASEGTVTATDLYWPSGADAWTRTGDTAYLYDPQGRLVSSLAAGSAPVLPTTIPTPTQTSGGQVDLPQISITDLNLQGQYLKLKNNGMTPVVMTGWKITNGKGRSITFIDWPRGDGSTFTFVLYPLNTVTVYYAREGTVTANELYWPSGADAWTRTGDTAYLYDPQGRLVSSLTA